MSNLILSVAFMAFSVNTGASSDDIVISSIDLWIQGMNSSEQSTAFTNITCSDGVSGLGQLGPYWHFKNDILAIWQIFKDEVIPGVLNYSCTTHPKNVMNTVIISAYKNTGQMQSRALAGLSFAIYEIHAKRASMSVADYLGGDTSVPVPIYGSSVTRKKTAEQIGSEFVSLHKQWGITAFKLKVAQRMGNNTDVWPNRSQEVVETVRQMVGDNITLMADANGGWTDWATMQPVAQLMADNDYLWLEEPFPWWQYKQLVSVAQLDEWKAMGMELALGEQEYRMEDGWQTMIDAQFVRVIQPDVCYGGGFWNLLQVAQWSLDQQSSFPSVVIPHSPSTSDYRTIYALHFYALKHGPYPNIGQWMEFGCDGGIPTKASHFVFDPPLKFTDSGEIVINQGIGWGYTLKPSNAISHFYHAQI